MRKSASNFPVSLFIIMRVAFQPHHANSTHLVRGLFFKMAFIKPSLASPIFHQSHYFRTFSSTLYSFRKVKAVQTMMLFIPWRSEVLPNTASTAASAEASFLVQPDYVVRFEFSTKMQPEY